MSITDETILVLVRNISPSQYTYIFAIGRCSRVSASNDRGTIQMRSFIRCLLDHFQFEVYHASASVV